MLYLVIFPKIATQGQSHHEVYKCHDILLLQTGHIVEVKDETNFYNRASIGHPQHGVNKRHDDLFTDECGLVGQGSVQVSQNSE